MPLYLSRINLITSRAASMTGRSWVETWKSRMLARSLDGGTDRRSCGTRLLPVRGRQSGHSQCRHHAVADRDDAADVPVVLGDHAVVLADRGRRASILR